MFMQSHTGYLLQGAAGIGSLVERVCAIASGLFTAITVSRTSGMTVKRLDTQLVGNERQAGSLHPEPWYPTSEKEAGDGGVRMT